MRSLQVLLYSFVLTGLLTQPVAAQNRYSSWSDPDGKNNPAASEISKLIEEMNALVDEAAKARAANPLFLQDLKDVLRKYSNKAANAPVSRRLLFDDFGDGDYTRTPTWTVRSGQYRVEKGWGLRSVAVAATGQQQQPSAEKDPAAALLGALLQGALGGKSQTSRTTTAPAATPAAVIHTAANISNAFDVALEFSSWKTTGKFSLGPYQGSLPRAGYRLVYQPGQPMELVRIGSRGTFVLNRTTRPVSLEDKKVHKLLWTRDTSGRMQITLDGQLLIDVPDQNFRDAFQGMVIINQGTDVIVKSVTLNSPG